LESIEAEQVHEAKAKAAYEEAERERIRYYFRQAADETPATTPAQSPDARENLPMQRCRSAPQDQRGGKKRPVAVPTRDVEVKQLADKAKAAKEDVRVTLNFVDVGDRYVIQVHPDLPIGAAKQGARGTSSPHKTLKSLIEDISGVPPSQQTLFCHRSKMGNDRHTLRSYHAHNEEIIVRFARCKQETPSITHACTAKWRQHQSNRLQRRERARACSETSAKHRVMQDWQSCVVPSNGTFFQYAKRGIEGKLAARFDLHAGGETADIRTNLFHDPFASFGDYHTWRPDQGVTEWDRLRGGLAYSHKIDYVAS